MRKVLIRIRYSDGVSSACARKPKSLRETFFSTVALPAHIFSGSPSRCVCVCFKTAYTIWYGFRQPMPMAPRRPAALKQQPFMCVVATHDADGNAWRDRGSSHICYNLACNQFRCDLTSRSGSGKSISNIEFAEPTLLKWGDKWVEIRCRRWNWM